MAKTFARSSATTDTKAAGALGIGPGTMGGSSQTTTTGNTQTTTTGTAPAGLAADTGGVITTGTTTSATNAWKTAQYPTKMPNGKTMVGSDGKPLPSTVDGLTYMASLFLSANQNMADTLRTNAAAGGYYDAAGIKNYQLKLGSKFTTADATALQGAMQQASNPTSGLSQGAPVDIRAFMGQQDSIASSPYFANSTYSRISRDQPNVVASNNVVNDLFLQFMGRKASDQELAAYGNAYLKYAAANPTMNETGSTSYTPATNPTSGTVSRVKSGQTYNSTSNDLTENQFVENSIRQSGEYNAYTAAGTAFDMMQKLATSNMAGV